MRRRTGQQSVDTLGGKRADAYRVAGMVDGVSAEPVDLGQRGIERGQIRVDVGNDGDARGHGAEAQAAKHVGSLSASQLPARRHGSRIRGGTASSSLATTSVG